MSPTGFQRNTLQRRVIVEELRKLNSHPTAVGLYEIVRRRLSKISLGTIYRNLELLAEMGIIRKLDYGGSEARFDGNVERHDHVRCTCCGRVDDLHGVPLDLSRFKHHDLRGYQVLDHRLEFVGICPRCRTQKTPDHGQSSSGVERDRDGTNLGGNRALPAAEYDISPERRDDHVEPET